MRGLKKIILLLLLTPLITGCANINVNNVADMLVTFSSNFPQIKNLIFGFSYLFGFFCMISAIDKLKNSGHGMQSEQLTRGALIQLFMGIAFLALPSFIKMALFSLWGTASIMSPSGFSQGSLSLPLEKAIVGLIQLFGYIGVVRGLIILNKVAHQQSPQEGFGKGIVHVIGGILSINIMRTIEMIKNSFGV